MSDKGIHTKAHRICVEAAIQDCGVPREVFMALNELTGAERLAVFEAYCHNCGAPDPTCQCWNEE